MTQIQEKEELIHKVKEPQFEIKSDVNEMSPNPRREARIVPQSKGIKITNPTPAGE